MEPRGRAVRRHLPLVTLLVVALGACTWTGAPEDPVVALTASEMATSPEPAVPDPSPTVPLTPAPPVPPSPPASTTTPTASPDDEGRAPMGTATPAPDWLGTRVLEEDENGRIPPQPTPPELVDRRIVTTDLLPPPADDGFASRVQPVPDEVLERSTWQPDCPVGREDLRYVTVTFHGFDGEAHTGELLVHADVAEDVAAAFAHIYAARFPIEEMRIVTQADLDAPPTGDGNNTTAFVCRPVRGASSWSEHAYGRAVDVNPFHNPYERDGIVLPELATAYTDRDHLRPGMILAGGPVVEAFAAAGWGWGGTWSGVTDPMHFSVSGR